MKSLVDMNVRGFREILNSGKKTQNLLLHRKTARVIISGASFKHND